MTLNSQGRRGAFLLKCPIAHRGLHDAKNGVPENSLKAFEAAVEHGYAIELDVRLSRDGRVIVLHDDDLVRMTGKTGKVAHIMAGELRKLRLAGTDQQIPFLEEALKLIRGRVPVVVEIKYNGVCSRALEAKTAKILQNYAGEYAVKSFNPLSVWYFKKHYPEVVRGQLVSDLNGVPMGRLAKWLVKRMLLNRVAQPDFISCELRYLQNERIMQARKDRLVLGWTAQSQDDLKLAKKWCDNVIFEHVRP